MCVHTYMYNFHIFSPPPPPLSHAHKQIVPYSDHSSFKELREFVRSIRPRSVKPIVHRFTGDKSIISIRADMSVFKDCLEGLPPVSDLSFMLSKSTF